MRLSSRRSFLAAAATLPAWAAKGQDVPGEAKRFLDAATEFEILRLTSLEHNSWLPRSENRAFSRRSDFLYFASDRDGGAQIYRYDWKANKLRELTTAGQLRTECFTLAAGDRQLFYLDGRKLIQTPTSAPRDRVLFELSEGWDQKPHLVVSEDAMLALAAGGNGQRTRLMQASRGAVAEIAGVLGSLALRPRQAAASFVCQGELRLLGLDSKQETKMKTAAGEVLNAVWSADGQTLLYLLKPAGSGRLAEIRELQPETSRDALLTRTSQFGHFARNSDASVFLGVSSSLASPYVYLQLRTGGKELTISEHRCSTAALTRAVFSPSNTRIAYQTDRHGKSVIYGMNVERLIEESDEA